MQPLEVLMHHFNWLRTGDTEALENAKHPAK